MKLEAQYYHLGPMKHMSRRSGSTALAQDDSVADHVPARVAWHSSELRRQWWIRILAGIELRDDGLTLFRG